MPSRQTVVPADTVHLSLIYCFLSSLLFFAILIPYETSGQDKYEILAWQTSETEPNNYHWLWHKRDNLNDAWARIQQDICLVRKLVWYKNSFYG